MNAIAQASSVPESGPKLDNRRMLAALIDLALVGAGAAAVMTVGGGGTALAAVVVLWGIYYYFACESGGGQTVGKRLMKLRVVRVDGSAPAMGDVAARSALRVIDTALVGLVVMLVTGERRARIGDLVAGTKVVSAGGAVPAAPAVAAPATSAVPLADAPVVTPAVEAPVAEEPVVDEPVAGEPVVAEPVAEEPIAEEPADELDALDIATPSMKELAQDVAAATAVAEEDDEPVAEVEDEPVAEVEDEPVAEVEDEPVAEVEDEPQDEQAVTVKSVETVSAIDLIMGADEPAEDGAADDEQSADATPA